MANTKDMSAGKPLRVLLLFTLPMILSVAFQQLYNVADSVIAGRFIGGDALAAVSASYPITMIFTGLGTGLGVGCSVVTGRLYGERAYGKLKSAVSTAFLSFTVIALACSAAGYFAAAPVLRLLSTPEQIIADSSDYLAIYMLGLAFVFLYNLSSATFQALGNSRIPLFFLIFSTLFNIALDIVFIKACGMGVWSLSLATVIAQGVACAGSILVLVFVLADLERVKAAENSGKIAPKLHFWAVVALCARSCTRYFFGKKSYKRFDRKVLGELMTIGIPSAVQNSTVSIGQLFVQNLININGATVLAGYGAATKVNAFCISLLATVGNALSVFVSQNIGAGKPDRVKSGTRAGLAIIGVFTAIVVPAVLIFASQLVALFVDDVSASSIAAADVIAVGRSMLLVLTPFYALVIVKFVFDSVLKGAGYMIGFIASTGIDLVFRVAFSYVLFYAVHSYIGIWWSWPLGWIVGTVVSALCYFFGSWRKKVFTRIPPTAIEK